MPVSSRSPVSAALSYLFLLVIGVQGFHVVEHIVVVIQVSVMGVGLDAAHGLLGAQVDFEWLHFSYNLSFLATLVLLLAYGQRRYRRLTPATRALHLAVTGAVGLQTYHVAEHIIRIVQYVDTGCAPCEGLVGQLVPFIWPHLSFGLFAYIPLVLSYFAYGLHRSLAFGALPKDASSLGRAAR